MDIKIGFVESPRELVITTDTNQDEVAGQVTEALSNDAATLQLTDAKGVKYIVRARQIAYVELGTTTQRFVGFAGA
ncbi:DUF3107 domain-containing protein [Corynebacterium sp. YIM 101645]|uniref:DUF3107 domain-containing protein n=1 Tax=Corynebacterium lemuris TaxID=1859292 RepID=A0ABT2FTX2_9CORY|nr:DUF3107 domain-containing protein [Corynebacterium lemuris]MCS5478673.1 DUF3107 domain-containing protein [Corynebacterium lemuris]